MRQLTNTEIDSLASRPNVKKMAVENFLMSMGEDMDAARANLAQDARDYKWNAATINAIKRGMSIAEGWERLNPERDNPMTLADHAEAWAREQGIRIPRRDTREWDEMYAKWHSVAFKGFRKPGNPTVRNSERNLEIITYQPDDPEAKRYYVDWKLKEIRNVDDPDDKSTWSSIWEMIDSLNTYAARLGNLKNIEFSADDVGIMSKRAHNPERSGEYLGWGSRAAWELALAIDNDYDTYKNIMDAWAPNYQKKMQRGVYDREQAIKGIMNNVIPTAMTKLRKQEMLQEREYPASVKREVAEHIVKQIEENIKFNVATRTDIPQVCMPIAKKIQERHDAHISEDDVVNFIHKLFVCERQFKKFKREGTATMSREEREEYAYRNDPKRR